LLPPGLRVLAVARSDLLAGLEAAARDAGARIVTGAEVVAAEADGTLVFANGDRAHADLVIGCDGIASPVRRALGLELHRQRAQEGALRSIVGATQQELPPSARGRCIEIWNGTRRLLITPINTEEIYLALTCREDDDQARDTRVQPCWSESFPEWSFLLDRIDRSQVLWNVYTIVHSKRWSAGRACILGDAAHAQPPNLGQGGGMAMQNGLALAAHMANVRDPRDVPEALGAWEAATRPLTDECQRWACLWGELANIPNEARARIVRGAFSEPWVLSRITAASGSSPIAATDWRPASAR
ncbi:FAD-dependent oxidoreductase, partial [Achromobacter xylosoxidans]